MTDKGRQPVGPKTTVDCYEFWDRVFRQAGLQDYTEGYYHDDPGVPYEQAQQNQVCHLLDQIDCAQSSRVLELGCGNGRLLEEVKRRGGIGIGITISPEQVDYCTSCGLNVRLRNYRDIGPEWHGQFDAVVANGSIEHFVQPVDAANGQADATYRELFAICHRVLDPHSGTRKLVNTTINFDIPIAPQNLLKSPWSFRYGSNEFHCAMLARGFGGCYPCIGQFQRCAHPWFELVSERDATYDYFLTSEEWLRFGRRSLLRPITWKRLFPFTMRHPLFSTRLLFLLLVSQSWNWQFRSATPPMKHLWQTWQYRDESEFTSISTV